VPEHRPWIVAAGLVAGLLGGTDAHADLDAYIQKKDPAFAWTHLDAKAAQGGTVHHFKLISQAWRGEPWEHPLRVYVPEKLEHPRAILLFIGGGRRGGEPKASDDEQGFNLARVCGARVAVLPLVPNQPLMEGRVEDDLIAETFVRYLETEDETWPLLFPMVKSAVAAMDAVQQWAAKEGAPADSFVVTGASKRGWTTWLTAAVDKRVIAIAPMVIPTLNMKAQSQHQLEVFGQHSEQIDDYTRRHLTEQFDTPNGHKLWKMVDPFSYRERIKVPKLIINGTNDPYWTTDSLNLFWDDLEGPKYVVYLPNAGHGLEKHLDWAIHGIGALFRHIVADRPLPELSWRSTGEQDGTMLLTVRSRPEPKAAHLWIARTETRDCRKAEWTSRPIAKADLLATRIETPTKGYASYFADLTFDDGGLEYHLSTTIRQLGNPATKAATAAGRPKEGGAGRTPRPKTEAADSTKGGRPKSTRPENRKTARPKAEQPND
jgi:PhoPQ-activated pathogenicity-related protein